MTTIQFNSSTFFYTLSHRRFIEQIIQTSYIFQAYVNVGNRFIKFLTFSFIITVTIADRFIPCHAIVQTSLLYFDCTSYLLKSCGNTIEQQRTSVIIEGINEQHADPMVIHRHIPYHNLRTFAFQIRIYVSHFAVV